MKILRNYILRESIIPFVLSLTTLTCVFLLGNLIQLTNLVINKGVPLSTVSRVFVLYIPVLLGYTLPIACLVSVIMTFSKFSSENEILAMRTTGIHLGKILIPLIIIGLILSLFSVYLNERLIPYSHHQQRKLLRNLGAKNPTALLEPGIFIEFMNSQKIFIHKIDGNRLYNVSIFQPKPDGGPTRTIIAKRGEFTPIPGKNQIKLKLMDGTSDEPNHEDPNNFYKLNFRNYFMTLDLTSKKGEFKKKPKSMTLRELTKEIALQERLLVKPLRLQTEFLRKITWSFSPLVFILLGFPLAVITHRRERSANVAIAIFCAAIYYLLSMGCEALSREGIIEPMIIMWGPNGIALVAATILNYKCVS